MKRFLSQVYRAIPRPLTRTALWLANPKFNFGAVGIFFAPDGRVLLLNHVYRQRHPWALPGGYLKRGEAPEAGVLRELREETGLIAEVEATLCVDVVDRWQKEAVLIGTVDPTQAIALSHEIFEAAFVAPDDLPADTLPRQRPLIARASGLRRPR
jgi:ADP-ribose pyrophosphatase YjhB (NUDIX family)